MLLRTSPGYHAWRPGCCVVGQEDVQEENGRIPWVSCPWQVCGSLTAVAALMAAVGMRGIPEAREVLGPCSRHLRISQATLAVSAYSEPRVYM